jgi:membrane fusion protein (multidrug efflux system)
VANGHDLFRVEAIDALHAGLDSEGDVVRLSPAWLEWTYRLLAFVLVVAVAYGLIGSITEYASGPAVVRVDGAAHVTTPTAGVVVAVAVRPGQRVTKGQLMVRLYDGQETAALNRLQREFDLQLARVLRDPNDQAARQSLTALRADVEQATAQRSARLVRAPQAGIVSDVRVRNGQLLSPGEPVCAIVGDSARFHVDVLLPGQYRPLLHQGMSLRIELIGFEYSYQDLVIESVDDEVVGPNEARRYLGPELADSLVLTGPVVIVRARLPRPEFTSRDHQFRLFGGIPARGDVRVRTNPILVALIPALRALVGERHG